MLFNSYTFILLFLPIAALGFYVIGGSGYHKTAISWLVLTSLFFYGWWNPTYLSLIILSILFNYYFGVSLVRKKNSAILALAIIGNLVILGYFKYANFFVDTVNLIAGLGIRIESIFLPLAISFFTFQQIAYVVDCYRGEGKDYPFLHYCLFVTFFPQLIAGPIVYHKEIFPQFTKISLFKFKEANLAVGITIFVLGLFKKVVLADGLASHSTPVFQAAEEGLSLTLFEAWAGALAYTFQLYFDFSGYSDMAIGLARIFGIHLPVNFLSPYKTTSIIEFWKCWHITLSRFLRHYLYIPLGGNKKGVRRRYYNLMITMLLGGLWHGAGWTFVIWGGLHGCFLIINHAWRTLKKVFLGSSSSQTTILSKTTGYLLTFTCIVIGWVLFRSESVRGAINIYTAMFGGNGISLPVQWSGKLRNIQHWLSEDWLLFDGPFHNSIFGTTWDGIQLLILCFLIVWFLPNTQQYVRHSIQKIDNLSDEEKNAPKTTMLQWRPTKLLAALTALILVFCLLRLSAPSEFLYFQF